MNKSAYFLSLVNLAFSACFIAYIFPSFLDVPLNMVEKFPVPIC